MDEQFDHVCPLCCEELDISDREFYPCKCGYQVCMWCWHRIRESESGLCPACRTPYGEDPHQFSAVDVEEVLKANKEREAAAKRERKHVDGANSNVTTANNPSSTNNAEDVAAMEIPKDRGQLANMRVIRRNLVYAVGLPPNIATEEILRRPEYFGQYGKIAKIVLNRSQVTAAAGGTDSRRASASAYVTFAHKEDTLSCILALDGFYLENRNIRASYGTSKYCSAFIKNVRCNNPECTYLHEMGAAEDTFTKQEIQAGYVTSGRDVLARQQQIVAEQLRLGASGGVPPRKKVGGGGPSGTGRASTNPVFPPPEYDEPVRQAPHLVPAPVGVARSASVVASAALNPANIAAKLGRSASLGNRTPATAAPVAPAATRKPGATAAAVVAGVHSNTKVEVAETHSTLTALTPLKRSTKAQPKLPPGTGVSALIDDKSVPIKNGAKQKNGGRSPLPDASFGSDVSSVSSIGGEVIGPPLAPAGGPPIVGGGFTGAAVLESLGGEPVELPASRSSALGGEIFTGQLPSSSKSAIGSEKFHTDKIGGVAISPDSVVGGTSQNTSLWGMPSSAPGSAIGGSVIGPSSASTSALASILGINLPSGSGSLQESSTLWGAPNPPPVGPSPLSSLNSTAVPAPGMHNSSVGGSGSLIGGIPIGGGFGASINPHHSVGFGGNGGNRNDIALLQSLLPGVHITSGSTDAFGFGNMNSNNRRWDGTPQNANRVEGHTLVGWGTSTAGPGSSAVGAIGQNTAPQNQRRGPDIW